MRKMSQINTFFDSMNGKKNYGLAIVFSTSRLAKKYHLPCCSYQIGQSFLNITLLLCIGDIVNGIRTKDYTIR